LIEDGDDNIWDNRDFGVIISCERSGKPRFEESFRIGPTPGENWAKGFSAVERLVVYYASTSSDDEVPQRTSTTLTRILSDDTALSEFTPVEKLYITTINLLATATIASKKDVDAAKSALSSITTSLPPPPTPTTLPWELLHNSNLILDLCTIISSFFAPHLTSTTKKLNAHIPTLVSAATILRQETAAVASLLATEIDSEEGTDREQDLIDGVLGLDGVGKELRDWGVETVIEDVRGLRKAVSTSLAAVRRGE
jgi:N-terminal acetyltransferase B complex non-catalytic subunit